MAKHTYSLVSSWVCQEIPTFHLSNIIRIFRLQDVKDLLVRSTIVKELLNIKLDSKLPLLLRNQLFQLIHKQTLPEHPREPAAKLVPQSPQEQFPSQSAVGRRCRVHQLAGAGLRDRHHQSGHLHHPGRHHRGLRRLQLGWGSM